MYVIQAYGVAITKESKHRILQLGRCPYGEELLILFTLSSHGSFITEAVDRWRKERQHILQSHTIVDYSPLIKSLSSSVCLLFFFSCSLVLKHGRMALISFLRSREHKKLGYTVVSLGHFSCRMACCNHLQYIAATHKIGTVNALKMQVTKISKSIAYHIL